MNEMQEQDVRRGYHKPSVRVVELTSDEVMGTGCKTSSSAAVNNGTSCTTTTLCSALGS